MPLKKLLLASAISLAGTALAPAAILVDFDFAGNDGAQVSETGVVASGLSASDLTRASGMRAGTVGSSPANVISGGFSMRKPSGESTTSSDTLTEAFSKNIYATFSVTVQEGYSMNLASLDFGWARQNNKNRNLALLVSVGDNTFSTGTDLIGTASVSTGIQASSSTFHSIDLSARPELQSVTGTTVYFRLYMYGTQDQYEIEALSDSNNNPGLDLLGTVSAIPEPSSGAALTGTFILGLAAYRRRRP